MAKANADKILEGTLPALTSGEKGKEYSVTIDFKAQKVASAPRNPRKSTEGPLKKGKKLTTAEQLVAAINNEETVMDKWVKSAKAVPPAPPSVVSKDTITIVEGTSTGTRSGEW